MRAGGYVEPSGMYFSEYSDPARFLQKYRFWHSSDASLNISGTPPGWSGNYPFHTSSLSDYPFSPFLPSQLLKTSESAERFLYYYFDEYLNRHRGESVSGMLSWMAEREPLAWRYHDLGPSGNYSRKYLRSVSYPFDGPPMYSGDTWVNRTGIFSFGWEDGAGGGDKIFDDNTKSLLPHYQLSSIVNQIQSCLEYVFQNPHINSGHPTPDLHLIAGIPAPQLPKHISLQLNHLNLKPTGWLESQPNVLSVIPNSGYYPFLDRVRQINYPLQYLRNMAAIINVSGSNEYRDPANMSLSGIVLNRPNTDVLRCLLHFGLLKNAPINVSFSGADLFYNQFPATIRDRFGNTDSSLLYYQYKPTFSYFLLPHYPGLYSGYFPPQVFSGTFSLPNSLNMTLTGIPATFGFSTDPILSSHVYEAIPATKTRNQAPFGGDDNDIFPSPNDLLYRQGNGQSIQYPRLAIGADYIFDVKTSWCLHQTSGSIHPYDGHFSQFINVPDDRANLGPNDFRIHINGVEIPISETAGYRVWAPTSSSRAPASGNLATICSKLNYFNWLVKTGYYDVNWTAQWQTYKLSAQISGLTTTYLPGTLNIDMVKNSINERLLTISVPTSSVTGFLPSRFPAPTGVWTNFNGTTRMPIGAGGFFNSFQNMWLAGKAGRASYASAGSSSELPSPDQVTNNWNGGTFKINSIDFNLNIELRSGLHPTYTFIVESGTTSSSTTINLTMNTNSSVSGALNPFYDVASSWWN